MALERAQQNLAEHDQCRALTVQMNIARVESSTAAQRAVIEQVGGVDVLVNSAAVLLGENDDVLSIEADDCRQTSQTNLFGLIEVCLAFGPTVALD